jgi:hypothetical protein
MNSERQQHSVEAEPLPANWLDSVQQQVQSLRFGIVQIVVHDSRVVQIERTEKIRFDHRKSDH